jgi:2-keto-4-pentenoate hydratase
MMGTDIEAAAIAAALGAFAWGAIADAALGLEPGDVILSGSFTQAFPVAAGDTVNTDFGEFGRLSITFANEKSRAI